MDYVYPAVFCKNDDDSFTITYPDLPGCISEGKSLANALKMAQAALAQWVNYLSENGEDVPLASNIKSIALREDEFASLISVDIRDDRAVRKTVSIPKWMDEKATESGLSLSRVLQEGLSKRL